MLKEIIKNKINEVEANKKRFPLSSFKYKLKNSERNFKNAVSKNKLNLIAEFKRKSPSQKNAVSRGLRRFFDIKKNIKAYDKYADAISILTDKKFFDGSLNDMRKAGELSSLPILRKDFIIDEYQIYESRLYNADAILLIASELSKDKINKFIEIAKRYNMDCLVEVHTQEELDKVLGSKAEIIGINNRNLHTLKVDTDTTLRLINTIPRDKIVVSESGILSKRDINKIKGKVNAVLIGTLFMNDLKNLISEADEIFSQVKYNHKGYKVEK